ncbi:LysR family nitrogen assimilation transcriptional regulator [Nitrobacteraceae bacterium AZCC 2161]
MDIRHISAFVAVFEEGSINQAAVRLGSAQPSVSTLIRDLETELKTPLFERLARGVRPIGPAETVYGHFQAVLREIDAARQKARNGADAFTGTLRVGLAPTVTKGILPKMLADFLRAYPKLDVRLTEAFSGKLTEWTVAGEIDFSIVAAPPGSRQLITRRIAVEPIVLISGPESGRKHLEKIRLPDQDPIKLVLPWTHHSIRSMLDRFLRSGDIPVGRTIEIDSVPGMLGLVRESDWSALLSITSVMSELASGALIVQPIEHPAMSTEFYMIHPARQTLSPAAIKFSEAIERGFAENLETWMTYIR